MPKKKKQTELQRRVRTYLVQHNLTQSALAEQIGITASHLSEILSGKEPASLRVAVALEDHTGVPARDFAVAS